jgi:hypothetical protein
MSEPRRREAAASVKRMFYHGYDSYMKYAFPHDELRPISKTYTDSLGELGNLNKEHLSETYSGVALTLIDSMSTLAVLGNVSVGGLAAAVCGQCVWTVRVDRVCGQWIQLSLYRLHSVVTHRIALESACLVSNLKPVKCEYPGFKVCFQ